MISGITSEMMPACEHSDIPSHHMYCMHGTWWTLHLAQVIHCHACSVLVVQEAAECLQPASCAFAAHDNDQKSCQEKSVV